jgi:hypothetical protein
VGGTTKIRTGLQNLNTTNTLVSAGYDADELGKIDTITLFASYYGAIIHTGKTGDTEPTLPIGLDPFSLYTKEDMTYIDELHAIFGDSGGAGTTYTMRNDIDMGAGFINRLTNNEFFNAGTGGRIVIDGGEDTLIAIADQDAPSGFTSHAATFTSRFCIPSFPCTDPNKPVEFGLPPPTFTLRVFSPPSRTIRPPVPALKNSSLVSLFINPALISMSLMQAQEDELSLMEGKIPSR